MPFDAIDLQWAVDNFADRDLRLAGFLRVTSERRDLEGNYSISISNGKEAIETPEGKVIPVVSGSVTGTVDQGKLAQFGTGLKMALISGWAADIQGSQPASEIILIANGTVIYAGPPSLERPDVAIHFGDDALTKSGFALSVPASALGEGDPADAEVRVFALSREGLASELVYGQEFEWSD